MREEAEGRVVKTFLCERKRKGRVVKNLLLREEVEGRVVKTFLCERKRKGRAKPSCARGSGRASC